VASSHKKLSVVSSPRINAGAFTTQIFVKSDYDDKGKRLPGTEEAVFISSYRAVG
jgi:hypothetical protein